MENSTYALMLAMVMTIVVFIVYKNRFKAIDRYLDFMAQINAYNDVSIVCSNLKKVPTNYLRKELAVDSEERQEVINYFKQFNDSLRLGRLLSVMVEHKLNLKKVQFVTDYWFGAVNLKGASLIFAEIIYQEAMGVAGNEREKTFILNRCGQVLEFQEKVIECLEQYQKSPLTKGYEALAIKRKIEKLTTEFKS